MQFPFLFYTEFAEIYQKENKQGLTFYNPSVILFIKIEEQNKQKQLTERKTKK